MLLANWLTNICREFYEIFILLHDIIKFLYKNSVNNYINGYLSFCLNKPGDIKVWYVVLCSAC